MIIISELDKLLNEIQELREHMNNLINSKDDLLDPEIMAVSRMIDTLLNEYEKLINRKKG